MKQYKIPPKHPRLNARQTGNALTEYGLILALIAIGTIPALGFVGNTMSDSLLNVSNTLQNGGLAESTSALPGGGSTGTAADSGNGGTPLIPSQLPGNASGLTISYDQAGNLEAILSDGTAVASATQSGEGTLETAALVTRYASDQLAALAEELANDPDMDPSISDFVQRLADSSSELAGLEDVVVQNPSAYDVTSVNPFENPIFAPTSSFANIWSSDASGSEYPSSLDSTENAGLKEHIKSLSRLVEGIGINNFTPGVGPSGYRDSIDDRIMDTGFISFEYSPIATQDASDEIDSSLDG